MDYWKSKGPADLFSFPRYRHLKLRTRTEELPILVVGWNQRNVQMCTPLINMVHISGTLIHLVQRTMRSKVSPGLRIYTEEPPPSQLFADQISAARRT